MTNSEIEEVVTDAANEAVTEFERIFEDGLKLPFQEDDRTMMVDVLFAMGMVLAQRKQAVPS